MSLNRPIRPTCLQCSRMRPPIQTPTSFGKFTYRQSSSSPFSTAQANRRWPRLALTILGLTLPTSYFLFPSPPIMTPHMYSDQPVSSTQSISTQHKLITVPIPPSSKEFFERPYRPDGSIADAEGGEVVVQHMMIKSPDIQIERPYTPVNDGVEDGEVRMVVKRVRGGEVGRVVHNLKEGNKVGIRGPIPTFSIYPNEYDKIIMISTGTAITPFLQLLSKLPAPSTSSSSPKLHLIHSKPLQGREDWAATSTDKSFIPSLQAKFGSSLQVSRVEPGLVSRPVVENALRQEKKDVKERVLVLVCLPPMLMRPLCGSMLPNLDQGPVTGLLGELGLTNKEVWKLE
ncbi:hypothetical protein I302_105800 [Kwoniella bestiolae CBS 10118]|uniref:FAD-binding FR-type domain-containing protein n=1 Tax=Kwoniella bestiolae CBS 10118 TaxID=1296100 RepID=A0A1B9G274_9TREE|nr:hypothetical protein I302_04921 [Kwoniella bestiolae CBS 10118]OCF25111.1 hypothetical protein I302_04921 [Kwoniella bestiolae CBS 10118]